MLRGRYTIAAARMERQGTPLDLEMLHVLREHWDVIRRRLCQALNRTHPVFVPTGTTLDPTSVLGRAVYQTAAQYGLDPYALAVVVEQVYQETRTLYGETIQARHTARLRTGLTPAAIAQWERAGHDASSWPGLDALAAALVDELPLLGLGGAGPDAAGALWDLLRTADDRYPQRHDPALLHRAADPGA